MIRDGEEESYDNLDQIGLATDIEKLLRKAKHDCLNFIDRGSKASRVEYLQRVKQLS